MHELSICRSIVDIVTRHAAGRAVRTVHLQVGQLRQIVPDTLVYCWGLMNEDSALAGSTLEVDSVPAALRCRSCAATTSISAPVLRLRVVRGDRRRDRGRRGIPESPLSISRRPDPMGRFHQHDDSDHDHGDHSGYATGTERVEVLERIFDENDHTAAANRADLDAAGVTAVNLMSSPGAGKTALLRRTLQRLHGELRVGIVEGDIETSIDADRLAGLGAAVTLINTANGFGGECHLDAPMVRSALPRLPLAELDLVIVENVGNLVCPAEFQVGEHHRAMVYAITEGEEKPLKYPVMFRSADVVLVNKIDLRPHLDFDLDAFYANLGAVNPGVTVIETSARTGQGVAQWCAWLAAAVNGRATRPAPPRPPAGRASR